jgi:hypothetical protein
MLVGTTAPMAFCGFSVSQSFFEKKLQLNLSGGYGDYSSKSAGYSNKGWNYNGYLGARWNAWKDGAISANVGYYSGFRMV